MATRNLRADRADLVDLGDVTDVADVACMALLESAHHAGATDELAAPGRYTALELGGIISRTTWPRRWNCWPPTKWRFTSSAPGRVRSAG